MLAYAPPITIQALRPGDWPAVRAIYHEGIETRNSTFETEAPAWAEWDAAHRPDCRLVARADGVVAGWAALMPVSTRAVYAGVAESSVYVAAGSRGRGVGGALLRDLVAASEEVGVWTLRAGIFPENRASVALHVSAGFRIVGIHERIGQLDGTWRDVLLLERRTRRW
jgi:phosphinothricin acetyltransferase